MEYGTGQIPPVLARWTKRIDSWFNIAANLVIDV